MKIKFLLLGTSLSLIPTLSLAQCVATQDCATLGYTETSCNGGKGVKCPFGNKWACLGANEEEYKQKFCDEYGFTLACTGTGYAGGSGLACNNKYAQCTCASGYEWKNGACQQKAPDYSACQIGTLFYSDGTCSNEKISGKELLGVVIYEKTASESGWVMTVKPVTTVISWSTEYVTTKITDKAASASCTNTQKLVAKGSKYPAANAANNYNAGNKKWCLPSYNVLNRLANQLNAAKVNAGITTAGGTVLGKVSTDGYEYLWSSSEAGKGDAWYLFVRLNSTPNMGYSCKIDCLADRSSVRPVFAF